MKSVNNIILSFFLRYGSFLRFILVWGGAVALFGFFAWLGFSYGSDTSHTFFRAIFTAGILAFLAVIVFFSVHFYDTPEIIGKLSATIVALCVGGMIAGAGLGGHWGISAKILGMVIGFLITATPFLLLKRRQQSR